MVLALTCWNDQVGTSTTVSDQTKLDPHCPITKNELLGLRCLIHYPKISLNDCDSSDCRSGGMAEQRIAVIRNRYPLQRVD